MGEPVVTALASQLGDAGALSTTNTASALEASPQPMPCSTRPVMSGTTLWTSVSTSVPAAVIRSAASATGRRPTWLDRRPKTRSAAITATKYATAVSDRSAWLSRSVRRYSSYSGIGLADAANIATSEHAAPTKPIRDGAICTRGFTSWSGGLAAVDDHGVTDGERCFVRAEPQ